ncbi:MAG TPA: hypothetical protein VH374_24545 [Polyangia bacterium]|nr:hypothetical protein [Polyangia bacterium]
MRTFLAALVLTAALWPCASVRAESAPRVSVQPFDGDVGPALRDYVARALRVHGYQIVTSIPRAAGTGPYLSLAQDHRLTAFVTGDVEVHGSRRAITFLVWNGATASVVGRWSAEASSKQIRHTVARGFWKHLSKALAETQAPPRSEFDPAPTKYIDASLADR